MACCTATAWPLPGAAGHQVLARGGIMPAPRLRLSPGVRAVAVAAAPATVGWARLGMLVTRVAAGADKGRVVPSSVVGSLSLDGTTDADLVASPYLQQGDGVGGAAPGIPSGLVASLSPLDGATDAGVVTSDYILSIGSKEAAAGGPARGSARGAGMLFLHGDASASLGISSAALASASASRGGGLVVAAMPGSEGPGDTNSDDYTKALGGFVVHDILTTLAHDAVLAFDDIVPATAKEQFATKYTDVKTGLAKAVMLAQGRSNKIDAAQQIKQGWYGIVELAHASYPDASLPALPEEQAFLDLCLAAGHESVILGQAVAPLIAPLQVYNLAGCGMADSDVDLIRSVFIAVAVCQAAVKTARGEAYIV